jgi:hypothetical protein
METASLKSFATWARTALIREVTARIAVVLAPGSPERVEQPKVVAALEKAVNAAGGGNKGRSAVADRVAYTWFNRIIALRFMDANGYTGIGVVSPQAGVDVGQPEILAEAKRANIDPEVVSQQSRETVTGLLNGTRRSDDPQGEAYALLLAEYCRHWNRSMPFMFERAGDFTELLIPANLLADESVLNRAVTVMTAEVCQDVEVIGWLYQFYISERKDEVFAGFKKNKKAGEDEIPAATQLFTRHWIVRYLVENSLGRLWMLNRPNSRLLDHLEYYIAPVDAETDFLKINSPEELKVIDPACGSGHMLTYAFELLYAIYEEEGYALSDIPRLILANNLYGTEIDPRAGALAAFALTMKARARQRTFFSKQAAPNICVLEPSSFAPSEIEELATPVGDRSAEEAFWNQFQTADTIGALIRPNEALIEPLLEHLDLNAPKHGDLFQTDLAERARGVIAQAKYLSRRYNIVVTNPPYMGSANMNGNLTSWIRENYAETKQDLYSCFTTRAIDLLVSDGIVAIIIGDTWMSIKTFEAFRIGLLKRHTFVSFLHLHDTSNHPDVFGANAAFILSTSPKPDEACMFVSLEPLASNAKRERLLEAIKSRNPSWVFSVKPTEFQRIPGMPLAYWLSERMFQIFELATPLSQIADVKHGLSTGKNAAVVRMWWEISLSDFGQKMSSVAEADSSGRKWFPYNKGGEYRRWYGNFECVLRYDPLGRELMSTFSGHRHDGKSHYFREGITWTFISSSYFAARYTPRGSIFDVSGSSLFPKDPRFLLGFLCSDLASEFLSALNPTLNFQVGNIKSLPILAGPMRDIHAQVESIVDRQIQIHVEDWDSFETSWDYKRDGLISDDAPAFLHECWLGEQARWMSLCSEAQDLESQNSKLFRKSYGLDDDVSHRPPRESLSMRRTTFEIKSVVNELVSYAVGCMFGRYSLDEPGLVLADQGATLQDYLARVPLPTFAPDADNVIPVVDGDWFEDDIVARFRQFLRVAFGEQHFEENLRCVTESLGVNGLRDYFVKSFYEDHWKRYKRRPIYWLFSSPKGSFNALIYMHRYTPSTVSTVLNEYLREYKAKLGSSLQHYERLAAGGGTPREQGAAQKESDRLRKVLLELDEYEHDVLYPLASRQIQIDLDDGVRVNYPKFGAALKKIPGLEVAE